MAAKQSQQGKDIRLSSICVGINGTVLLENAPLNISQGNRYGLIGKNGVGKTTLLRQIESKAFPNFPVHLRCFLVSHEAVADNSRVLDVILSSDTERTRLLEEEEEVLLKMETCDDQQEIYVDRLEQIYIQLSEIGSETADVRVRGVLRSLQFDSDMMEMKVKELSGGWRMRVALACAVFVNPDLLLLDEPSNHLDIHTICWLRNYLTDVFNGTVIVVSHDRSFLNAVCTHIVEMRRCTLTYYHGNYEAFEKIRSDTKKKWDGVQNQIDGTREHMKQTVAKMEKAAARQKGKHRHDEMKSLNLVASRKKKINRHGQEKTTDGFKWNCQRHGARPGSHNINAGGWVDREAKKILDERKQRRY